MTSVIQHSGDPSRELAFECVGDPGGTPVFLLHGTPGSRRGPRPRASVLYRLGIKLICYDRPGYGQSSPAPGRSVADAAADVRTIASHLRLDRFAVVGRSGGAPHALACAALLGGQVSCAAALVGVAPPDAAGLDWYDGMADSNTSEYLRAGDAPSAAISFATVRAGLMRDNPAVLLDRLRPQLTPQDRRIVDEASIQNLLIDSYHEAVRQGATGWVEDTTALRSPWGFDLASISVPVLIWHGLDDVFSPVNHSRWMAAQIRSGWTGTSVELVLKPDAAHFDAVRVLPDVLTWVKRTARSERLGVERPQQAAVRT